MNNDLDPPVPEQSTSEQSTSQAEVQKEHVVAELFDVGASNAEAPLIAPLNWTQWISQGLRASVFRRLGVLPEGPTVWQMLLIVGVIAATLTLLERFTIDGPVHFDYRSWLFSWASTALLLFGVWTTINFRSALASHRSPVAAWFVLVYVAALPLGLVGSAINIAASRNLLPAWWTASAWIGWAIYIAFFVWYGGITWQVTKAVHRSIGVTMGVVLWSVLILGVESTVINTRSWYPIAAEESDSESQIFTLSQEVFESQQALLNESLQGIKTHEGSQRQIYGLIYAPYAQDVFLRESAMVKDVLEQQFNAQGRIVQLLNSPKTVVEMPWATNRNLERSLAALAKAMDIENDVLVLYLTSHGGADFKLATYHYPLEVESLTATQLREMLDKLGIRNRVIAVSACYSGGWVEPLASDNTLVMTAADKDHTSYGCGNKSPLTYFGKAVFDEQLRTTTSFEDAFRAAVPIIKEREEIGKKEDGFSNPQISVGKNIQVILGEWGKKQSPEGLRQ